jgi:hypothetical protein
MVAFTLSSPVVREAAETRFSRDGNVPPAPPNQELGAPRARDGPLQGLHVAHYVQKLAQSSRQLGRQCGCGSYMEAGLCFRCMVDSHIPFGDEPWGSVYVCFECCIII